MKVGFSLASWLAVVIVALLYGVGFCHADPALPIRLAIVSEDTELLPVDDFLTAELSKDSRLTLLERDQITKVLNEQALTLDSGGHKDYVKAGELLGADGVLVVTLAEKEDRQVVSCRLVAVKPGVELGLADYDFPLADPEEWSKLVVSRFAPLMSKLTVTRQEAVPISILNVRSAAASLDSDVLDRQLTLLLHDRLMAEKKFFVLERRSMETLTDEKEENPVSESPFWNSSFLVEGTINPQGYDSNQVTVDIQITQPDKKNVVALEVAGARSNLTQVINDLATRIAASTIKGGMSTNWSAADEAERYFEEGQWMLRWGMAQEAKEASEAAWALGKQTQPAAELRIKAYQACGGDPGTCAGLNHHVVFVRPAKEGLGAVGNYYDFGAAPPGKKFSASIRAAELWLDGLHASDRPQPVDSSWNNLGPTSLDQLSSWLRYFYFTVEARSGAEDDIRHARLLCREIAQELQHRLDGEPAEKYLRTVAEYTAFWSETPEETLRAYRELVDKGQWPAVRTRFFNDAYKEEDSSTVGGGASEYGDECSPCLAGWDWQTRQRCPELWNSFIDELCASPKPLIQMEGLMLRCSYSWSQTDFKDSRSRMQDFILQHVDLIASAGLGRNVVRDTGKMMGIRSEGLSVQEMDKLSSESWENFMREITASLDKEPEFVAPRPDHVAQATNYAAGEEYLRTQTNFDFKSFASVLLQHDYNADEAKSLLSLLTNYQNRIDVGAHDVFKKQHDFWVKALKETLDSAISPPKPVVVYHKAPTGAQSPNRNFTRPPGLPPVSGMALQHFGSVAQSNPSAKDEALSAVKSSRFWRIADEEIDPQLNVSLSHIAASCYRDGTLWLQVLSSDTRRSGSADFYGVNLQTFASRRVLFQAPPYTFFGGMAARGSSFDVDSNYLYISLKDGTRRYSFQRKTWENFLTADVGVAQRVGGRLFFTSADSIYECLPDGSLPLLASCRRRPAISPMDEMADYSPCHLFLDSQGRINICVSNELYTLSGANDWQKRATLPTSVFSSPAWFENGFVVPSGNDWWGMFGPCPRPEVLFQRPSHWALALAPRWREEPPSRAACQDGDCLWFVTDSAPSPAQVPGAIMPRVKAPLSLVRYKYDEPKHLRIALKLLDPLTGHETKFTIMNQWSLTETSEGFAITDSRSDGFWLIAKADLNQAVAEASARQTASP